MPTVTEIEQQLAQAKVDAAQADKDREALHKQQERERAELAKGVRAELGALKRQVESLPVADKSKRPGGLVRGLARLILTEPPGELSSIHRLSAIDPDFGRIAGTRGALQNLINRGQGDAECFALADDLECRCHRATLAYLRWLSGETS